ncbi:hypothetical protein MIT9_P1800 [Methylomarinovum caldicuralii]|uniref:VanZ-like domain-containing protein n=1 Tax=Methylomarinovum caldicuralii TaxID=438856 RepID=A0AAU9C4U4_9GAMM|nr:VanZ family protein [Methylomarinovum caldicuralii]BCX82215.1 hypothetical protein MIT9_P1800 [Methylomarinovum caldicuralii]
MRPSTERRRLLRYLCLYLGFVVYGSLIPFRLRPLSLAQALENFQHIAYLQLGPGSRADWIANIVLYLPLAFLACGAFLGLRQVRPRPLPALVLIFGGCLAVAVAVEFVQQFFAPRTVSLNDLIAEGLGSLGGILLWWRGRSFLVRLGDAFTRGGRESLQAAAIAYLLAYVALALFPYDIALSPAELGAHLTSANVGWLVAPGCGGPIRCGARLGVEIVAVVPLGLLLGLLWPAFGLRRLAVAGLLLGAGLELLQLFILSASAQGISLVTRVLGVATGGMLASWLRRQSVDVLAHMLNRALPFLAFPYLFTLLLVNAWFTAGRIPFRAGLARLTDLHFTPFYYHYYSSEPVAMASLLANLALYVPIGIAVWCRRRARRFPEAGGAGTAAWLAALLALPVETGKLWLAGHHPDPTNLLIAAAAAALAYGATAWLARTVDGSSQSIPSPPPSVATPAPTMSLPGKSLAATAVTTAILLTGLAGIPHAGIWPGIVAGYALLLWFQPLAWLFVLPFCLPLLDLAPLEGRLPLDEFDLLVLATLAVVPLRLRQPPRPWPGAAAKWAVTLLWLSWLVATARGLRGLDFHEPLGSHSPLNAWLVGKGLLWSLLLLPLLRRVPESRSGSARRLVFRAVVAALAVEVLVVIRERVLFVGLTDFDHVFRVTGTFASMQTGGAYLEAFLAFAFPFLLVGILRHPSPWIRLAGAGLAGLSAYAMLVTFSRGGYAGMAAGFLTVALGARRRWPVAIALAALLVLIAAPILSDGFARYRLQRSGQDLTIRWQHWQRALALMDAGWPARLAGNGFGRYPLNYLLYNDYDRPPGGYLVRREGRQHFLRLLPGESVYLDQRVALAPHTPYRLQARLRVSAAGDALTVPLCEKALLYSFRCHWQRLQPERSSRWEPVSRVLHSGELGDSRRPVKLSLYNAGDRPLDVDDLHLLAPDGTDLLRNGGFEHGDAFWLLVTDRNLAWHIDQAGIEVYFAQGWLGLLGVGLLLYAATRRLWPGWREGRSWELACLGGLAGFVTVSLTGSTMDVARGMMLFYFTALCAMVFRTSPSNLE